MVRHQPADQEGGERRTIGEGPSLAPFFPFPPEGGVE